MQTHMRGGAGRVTGRASAHFGQFRLARQVSIG
ncbi:hypothetical protein Fuma_01547 [Fuerstiella marisgermanici]|uniref:Uncharacterized protein n=1 Tax=Fuerstiella marisgermanici TaxID=1891926 RepID=A0A1P8WD05_9PLAN|nr:hypothetical protein Fuma_01547 [Fuerstiella marisgermanici]